MLGDPNVVQRVIDLSTPVATNSTLHRYNFSAQIYLDRNEMDSKTYYTSQTIVNTHKSFYYLNTNKNTTCFINLYFDQVEMARREMIKILQRKEWSKPQVDSIFYATTSTLKRQLNRYLNTVDQGENEASLWKFIDTVKSSLNIDNSILIEDDETRVHLDTYVQTNPDYLDYYNYGSALLKIEKYIEAKEVLLQVLQLGDNHPWVFYNLGLACLKLDEKQNACQYFRKSIALGERVEPELMHSCKD